MTYEKIVEALEGIHSGSFFRIGYETELPLKSSFAKQGYKITRTCQSTVRTGVSYRNIRFVIEERSNNSSTPTPRKSNIVPVIQNRLYKNSETGQMYLRIFPTIKGTNKNGYYCVSGPDFIYFTDSIDDSMREMIRDSYFNGKFSPISMIKIENIYKVGDCLGSFC